LSLAFETAPGRIEIALAAANRAPAPSAPQDRKFAQTQRVNRTSRNPVGSIRVKIIHSSTAKCLTDST
jgi:hypothetical protein